MTLQQRWDSHFATLKAQGRFRSLQPPQGHDFTSNDYLGYGKARIGLGLAQPPDPADPVGHGPLEVSGLASRLLRGHHPLWEEVESRLAHWHGAETALVFNSGYIANEGLLATLLEPTDWVASDQFNHASLIDGLRASRAERFIFPHNDLTALAAGLKKARANRPPDRELFIVTESLFSMEGDQAPLTEMAALAQHHGAYLIVDEAHATGCFGASGSGLVDHLGLRSQVLATVHTGGKALGVLGPYICCSHSLKALLVSRCRHLIFSTALPPIVAQWWLHMLGHVSTDQASRDKLQKNSLLFQGLLSQAGLECPGTDFIVPVVLGEDTRAIQAAQALQHQGFDIRAIRPPTVPPGTARLRVSLHADHSEKLITEAAEALIQVVLGLGSVKK